jgi:predicted transcriptional regulator
LPNGDRLLAMLAALANPHRLRVMAALTAHGRNYVSRLAREVGISRPLLHLHLGKLEEAGLVTSQLELSSDGKALNYFQIADFDLRLTPAALVAAAASLSEPD